MDYIGVGDVVYFESYTDGSDYYKLLTRGTGIVCKIESLSTGGELCTVNYIDKDGKPDSTTVCMGVRNFEADTIRLLTDLIGD